MTFWLLLKVKSFLAKSGCCFYLPCLELLYFFTLLVLEPEDLRGESSLLCCTFCITYGIIIGLLPSALSKGSWFSVSSPAYCSSYSSVLLLLPPSKVGPVAELKLVSVNWVTLFIGVFINFDSSA